MISITAQALKITNMRFVFFLQFKRFALNTKYVAHRLCFLENTQKIVMHMSVITCNYNKKKLLTKHELFFYIHNQKNCTLQNASQNFVKIILPSSFLFHVISCTPQNQLMPTSSVLALLYNFSQTQIPRDSISARC